MTWLRRVFAAVLAASTLISLGSQAWDRSRMTLAAQRLGPHAVAAVKILQPMLAEGAGQDETVLLAEDDDAVRKLTRQLLVSKGYRVLEADNGLTALRVAEGHAGAIDLLLTDVIMPRMDGHQLHARLQALRPGVRVVFMSGFSDVEIGEVPFIAKPFAAIKLLRTLREALAPKRAG